MHNHSHVNIESKEELIALLDYMVKHNDSHTHELSHLVDKFSDKPEVLALINEAISSYKAGNEKLQQALDSIK